MATFDFRQVDVFSSQSLKGNPLAVVVGADALTDGQMADLASWTNLSETTFLLRPSSPDANYRVRIFTPFSELPFAGHPTLGSCHVWLTTRIQPNLTVVVQECGAGLIRIRRCGDRLYFAAPKLLRYEPVEVGLLDRVFDALNIRPEALLAASWLDNGPDFIGLRLGSRAEVLAVTPDYQKLRGLKVGVVGPWDPEKDGSDAQFEVRAFISDDFEDPVTGSLNASLAYWLFDLKVVSTSYVASQGTALGRAGRVYVERDQSDIWVGGAVTTCITGSITL